MSASLPGSMLDDEVRRHLQDCDPHMSEQPKPGVRASVPRDRPKVVYVMGAGRSGSTILSVALGNCTNVFYAGELEAWLRRSGVPNFGGEERIRFWAGVREEVDGADLYGERAWRCFEHSLSLFRIGDWRARRQLRHRYRQIAEDLYLAVASASGAKHIVDPSHYPLRARELQALDGIELYIIYLARNPRAVVTSFNKRGVAQQRKAPASTNVYLWVTHVLSMYVFLRHASDRRLFVRYEDFIAAPETTLRQILRCIGLPAASLEWTALKTGIPFQGNRLLRSEVLPLDQGPTPQHKGRKLTALIQLPLTRVQSRLRPRVGR
jgi:Sulfotransferase family